MPAIKRILITGGTGQLGQSFKRIVDDFSEYDFILPERAELDLYSEKSIDAFFKQHQCDLIINCAAYTAVDKAESDPELANQINHIAVLKLAQIAQKHSMKLIHISTDYVFDGRQHRPYVETDKVAPQSVYGDTKLKGEQSLLQVMRQNAIVIRTSWVYSEFGNNFVKTMLKLGRGRDNVTVIFDQIGAPTYAGDLAQAVMHIVQHHEFSLLNFESQIYHYSNEGVCSWYDFANTIFELSTITCDVKPIEAKDYATPAVRPQYSVLNKAKIKQHYELTIPYWKDPLKECLTLLE